jgi:hypothetical protein
VYDSVASVAAAQKMSGRLCYFVPQFFDARGAEWRGIGDGRAPLPDPAWSDPGSDPDRIGLHPSCEGFADELAGSEVAGPTESRNFETYVNLSGRAGVLECLWFGRTAVVAEGESCEEAAGSASALRVPAATRPAEIRTQLMRAKIKGASAARMRQAAREKGCAPAVTAVYRKDAFLWAWDQLLARRCPTRSGSPEDGWLLHARYLLVNSVVTLADSAGAGCMMADGDLPAELCNGILLTDNRRDAASALAVVVSVGSLPRADLGRWRVVVACPDDAWEFYGEALACFGDALRRVRLDDWELPKRCFEIEAYNRLCKSSSFWDRVGQHCRTVMTVQNDGVLASRGGEAHPTFSAMTAADRPGGSPEYVGAPWTEHAWLRQRAGEGLVGNGGFSLRDVGACARACLTSEAFGEQAALYQMAPHMTEAEDVFFSSRLKTASRADAMTFSSEQVLDARSLGYHQFWRYHPVDASVRHFERLLGRLGSYAAERRVSEGRLRDSSESRTCRDDPPLRSAPERPSSTDAVVHSGIESGEAPGNANPENDAVKKSSVRRAALGTGRRRVL